MSWHPARCRRLILACTYAYNPLTLRETIEGHLVPLLIRVLGMPRFARFVITLGLTRVDKARHLPGSAAKSAAKTAHRHGYPRANHAESFYVHGMEGPLLDGEMARAAIWARELAEKVTAGSTTG